MAKWVAQGHVWGESQQQDVKPGLVVLVPQVHVAFTSELWHSVVPDPSQGQAPSSPPFPFAHGLSSPGTNHSSAGKAWPGWGCGWEDGEASTGQPAAPKSRQRVWGTVCNGW